ncbi:hypothetical protein B0H14DRAFT_2607169 [Mycena olivaceomarginata]|nr:hypothetical protein B0H14DRAFT_2607169 [Mycena olivaceomarginata]
MSPARNSGDKANERSISGADHQWCNYRRESYPYTARSSKLILQAIARLSLNEESGAALSFTAQDNGDESSDSQSLSDSGTGNESPSPEIEKKSSANKHTRCKNKFASLCLDPAAEPRQVPVLSNEIPISTITTADGGIVCNTLLLHSKRNPRLKVNPLRNVIQSKAGESIGKVTPDAFTSVKSMRLSMAVLGLSKINEINTYTLRASTAGQLFCDVFWDAEARGLESENIVPTFLWPSPPTARCITQTGRLAAPGVREVFLRFLHSVMTEKLDDVPDYGTAWPRAKYAGMLLGRILLQEKVLELFTAWSRPTGGYIVPAVYHNYAGTSFTKDEILDTLKIKSSSSSNDHLLFAPENLIDISSIIARTVGHRSSSNKVRVRRRSSPSSPGEGTSRKKHRKAVTVSDDESEAETRYNKSSMKKRAAKSITSEALDDSESS